MKDHKIWVVALDFSKMDKAVLSYAGFFAQITPPEKVYFIHVEEEADEFPFMPEEYQLMRNQIVVDKRLQLEHQVSTHFGHEQIQQECVILSGRPFEEVINFVVSKSAGIIFAGRKKSTGGSGIVSERLSRNLPCDFLLVPEGFEPRLKNILMTTDFSEHSSLGLQYAQAIKSGKKDTKLMVHHCYAVPMGYSKSGKSHDEFAAIMKKNAGIQMERWLNGQKIDQSMLTLKDGPFAEQVMEVVNANHIDLIVTGSKGQTRGSLTLLGSNTVKLMKGNDSIPLLIVKKEGENLSFLEALRQV